MTTATITSNQSLLPEVNLEGTKRAYKASKEAVEKTAGKVLAFFRAIGVKIAEAAKKSYAFLKENAIKAAEAVTHLAEGLIETLKTSQPLEMLGAVLFTAYNIVLSGLGYLAASGMVAVWVIGMGLALNLAVYVALISLALVGVGSAAFSMRNHKKEREFYYAQGFEAAVVNTKAVESLKA